MNAFAISGVLVAITSIGMSMLVYFTNRSSRITSNAGVCYTKVTVENRVVEKGEFGMAAKNNREL